MGMRLLSFAASSTVVVVMVIVTLLFTYHNGNDFSLTFRSVLQTSSDHRALMVKTPPPIALVKVEEGKRDSLRHRRILTDSPSVRFDSDTKESWNYYVSNRKVFHFKNSEKWSRSRDSATATVGAGDVDSIEARLLHVAKHIVSLYEVGNVTDTYGSSRGHVHDMHEHQDRNVVPNILANRRRMTSDIFEFTAASSSASSTAGGTSPSRVTPSSSDMIEIAAASSSNGGGATSSPASTTANNNVLKTSPDMIEITSTVLETKPKLQSSGITPAGIKGDMMEITSSDPVLKIKQESPATSSITTTPPQGPSSIFTAPVVNTGSQQSQRDFEKHHLHHVLQELKNCFGIACGNMQFNMPVDADQLKIHASASFLPMLKHIADTHNKLASTYSNHTTTSTNNVMTASSPLPSTSTSASTSSSSSSSLHTASSSVEKRLKIAVFNVWVSDEPIPNIHLLNQQQYCEFHGYDFFHLWMNTSNYEARYPGLPYGWFSVEFASELLQNYTEYDYVLKVDMDCIFSRLDLRLETLLHPKEHFSFYISQIEESRFTQSHSWIVKNDDFGQRFLKTWLSYRVKHCQNIAQEQGALHYVIGSIFQEQYPEQSKVLFGCSSPFDPAYSQRVDDVVVDPNTGCKIATVTEFGCRYFCHLFRPAYQRHHCVLDWYENNGFGTSGSFYHPKIYLFPLFEQMHYKPVPVAIVNSSESGMPNEKNSHVDKHFISPMDGYTMEIIKENVALDFYARKAMVSFPPMSAVSHRFKQKTVSIFQPLTVHPCKNNHYISPAEVMKNLKSCF
jgi:hypothetical protein